MMKHTLNMIAVDLGAESGRAMLGQFNGGQISLSEVHRFPNTPVPLPTGLYWNALGLWNEVRSGLGKAARATSGRLDSLGIDTWGVDFGLLDHTGALLGLPMHYRDSRTDGMMEAVFLRVPKEEIFAQTGIQFMQLNTLYQLYAMARKNSPQLAVAETFLTMPDLLNYWLTGQKVCEFTNATTTQCYDPRRKTWARPMLERLGIPTNIFPEIVPPGTVLGPLSAAMADEAGLTGLPVIAPACHDTGSAVAAVPAPEGDFVWISSGTWSIMGVETASLVINEEALACGMTNEGGVGSTFRLSKIIAGLWLVQECRRTWRRRGTEFSYDDLTRLAREAKPLKAIVDPDHHDFLAPGDMPVRIRAFCSRTRQAPPETPGDVVRCSLESLALKYRWVLERLERLQQRRYNAIYIVGGGTKNSLLSQLTADATGRQVFAGPAEATATGNLLLQAVALGEIGSIREAREMVARSFDIATFTPDEEHRAAWEDAYAQLNTIME